MSPQPRDPYRLQAGASASIETLQSQFDRVTDALLEGRQQQVQLHRIPRASRAVAAAEIHKDAESIRLNYPAAMAPSAAQLKEALIEGTREVYSAEPDGTSVNKVRRRVEEKLGLEDGFFTSETWKQKSKTIIKEQVVSINNFQTNRLCLSSDLPR